MRAAAVGYTQCERGWRLTPAIARLLRIRNINVDEARVVTIERMHPSLTVDASVLRSLLKGTTSFGDDIEHIAMVRAMARHPADVRPLTVQASGSARDMRRATVWPHGDHPVPRPGRAGQLDDADRKQAQYGSLCSRACARCCCMRATGQGS